MYSYRDETTGLDGYLGRDGWIIKPQFRSADDFHNGYAGVRLPEGSEALVRTDGSVVSLSSLLGNLASSPGEEIRFNGFSNQNSDTERYAAVGVGPERGPRRWSVLNTDLNCRPLPGEVFDRADFVYPYGEYLVFIRAGGTYGLFSLADRQLVLPAIWSCIYPSTGPIWVVSRRDQSGKTECAFFDLRTGSFLPGWFWGAIPFADGFGAVRFEDRDGYFVGEDLQPAFDGGWDDMGRFAHGLAAVYKDEDAGYIDTTGRMKLLLDYDELQPFNALGLTIANRDSSDWSLDIIDRTGQVRLAGLDTATFYDGDFPHFAVSRAEENLLLDAELQRVL